MKFVKQGVLFIQGKPHSLLEIEFYFTSKEHEDPYTHCSPAQYSQGLWYFHVDKTNRGKFVYREQRFAGVDISLGDLNGGAGGILLRSILSWESDRVYCGPGQVMEYLVQSSQSDTVAQMVAKCFPTEESLKFNAQEEGSFMYMCQYDPLRTNPPRVIAGPRVGLFLTKKGVDIDVQIEYMMRNYRFCSNAKRLWKGKHYLVYSLLCQGVSPAGIHQITGVPEQTIQTWIGAYNQGKQTNNISTFQRRLQDESDLFSCLGAMFRRRTNKLEI